MGVDGHNNGDGRLNGSVEQTIPQCMTDAEWVVIARRLHLSPQQRVIARLIREEHLGNDAIALRMRRPVGHIRKQIERIYDKLQRDNPEEVRSRVALIDRIWVEYWRLRAERRG